MRSNKVESNVSSFNFNNEENCVNFLKKLILPLDKETNVDFSLSKKYDTYYNTIYSVHIKSSDFSYDMSDPSLIKIISGVNKAMLDYSNTKNKQCLVNPNPSCEKTENKIFIPFLKEIISIIQSCNSKENSNEKIAMLCSNIDGCLYSLEKDTCIPSNALETYINMLNSYIKNIYGVDLKIPQSISNSQPTLSNKYLKFIEHVISNKGGDVYVRIPSYKVTTKDVLSNIKQLKQIGNGFDNSLVNQCDNVIKQLSVCYESEFKYVDNKIKIAIIDIENYIYTNYNRDIILSLKDIDTNALNSIKEKIVSLKANKNNCCDSINSWNKKHCDLHKMCVKNDEIDFTSINPVTFKAENVLIEEKNNNKKDLEKSDNYYEISAKCIEAFVHQLDIGGSYNAKSLNFIVEYLERIKESNFDAQKEIDELNEWIDLNIELNKRLKIFTSQFIDIISMIKSLLKTKRVDCYFNSCLSLFKWYLDFIESGKKQVFKKDFDILKLNESNNKPKKTDLQKSIEEAENDKNFKVITGCGVRIDDIKSNDKNFKVITQFGAPFKKINGTLNGNQLSFSFMKDK